MELTRSIREVLPATPRARRVRIDLAGAPFSYEPGQAVMIASHGYARKRAYSIAAPPEEARDADGLELLIGVDADGNPGPHLQLEVGARVDLEGPLGRFTFPAQPTERRFLFIAGGTGISPLRAMLHRAMHVPHDAIAVLYSARTASEFAYESELRRLAREGAIDLHMRVTREAEGGDWNGPRGRVGSEDLATFVRAGETLCFVCGPATLVSEMKQRLGELGVPREHVRTEEWTSV